MSSFHKQLVVQLVSDQQVEEKRASYKGTWLERGGVREFWWRRISMTASGKGVTIETASIDEEAAVGGYCRGWRAPCKRFFYWEDLTDMDNIRQIFKAEQPKVLQAIESLVVNIRPHTKYLRELLAA